MKSAVHAHGCAWLAWACLVGPCKACTPQMGCTTSPTLAWPCHTNFFEQAPLHKWRSFESVYFHQAFQSKGSFGLMEHAMLLGQERLEYRDACHAWGTLHASITHCQCLMLHMTCCLSRNQTRSAISNGGRSTIGRFQRSAVSVARMAWGLRDALALALHNTGSLCTAVIAGT